MPPFSQSSVKVVKIYEVQVPVQVKEEPIRGPENLVKPEGSESLESEHLGHHCLDRR